MNGDRKQESHALTRVEGQLTDWRRVHGRRSKLPGELWDEIVSVARELGVNRTSRLLGLWYYAVKRRVTASQRSAASRAGFVEVDLVEDSAARGCVIEMDRADGARVVIREATAEHVAVIASKFLGGQP